MNLLHKEPRPRRGNLYLFIGGAGSGKSHLISRFVGPKPSEWIILSPTGISALNLDSMIRSLNPGIGFAGVSTIHAAFGLGIGLSSVVDSSRLSDGQLRALRSAKGLIIDEISMVRLDVLDRISDLLRQIRDIDLPFGGLTVFLFGDPYQLPPVLPDEDRPLLTQMYGRPTTNGYFFESRTFCELLDRREVRFFKKVDNHRHTDLRYAQCLQRLRVGHCCPEDLALLETRVDVTPNGSKDRVHLTVDTASSRMINGYYLSTLPGTAMSWNPQTSAVAPKFSQLLLEHPMNHQVVLKHGSRVLFTKNDPGGHWRNGSRGTVLKMTELDVTVLLDEPFSKVATVRPENFEITVPVMREGSGIIESEVVAVVRQLPLLGGNAMTIHRSQSLTIPQVSVGFGRGIRTPGQAYTALSRVRRLDDLTLTGPPHESYFFVPEILQSFMAAIAGITEPMTD